LNSAADDISLHHVLQYESHTQGLCTHGFF